MARPKKFDVNREIRKLARERLGVVKAGGAIEPKRMRKKPKHKKPAEETE